jgi:hypothetical protein
MALQRAGDEDGDSGEIKRSCLVCVVTCGCWETKVDGGSLPELPLLTLAGFLRCWLS